MSKENRSDRNHINGADRSPCQEDGFLIPGKGVCTITECPSLRFEVRDVYVGRTVYPPPGTTGEPYVRASPEKRMVLQFLARVENEEGEEFAHWMDVPAVDARTGEYMRQEKALGETT